MITEFKKQIAIRWADLDANYHVRHSVYYDYGAQHRIELLSSVGLTTELMRKEHFGPVIFREECVFRREIRFEDRIFIDTRLAGVREDFARWTIQHILSNEEGSIHAVITLDGAWIDTEKRRLADPTPHSAVKALSAFPRTEDFSEKLK